MKLLELSNAEFAYEHQPYPVFRNISFSMGPGEIFCLLGPNGCGKTTLLDCILGIHHTWQGKVLVAGHDSRQLRAGQMARYLAYVPQSHEKTFPYTVLDIVKMGRTVYTGRFSAPREEDEAIAREALDAVGLMRLADRPYTQISGGEGQLVMIARALAQKTPVIVMDEPTAHLDFKHEMVVLETMVRMVRDNGLSILMATHFPNHAFYFENKGLKVRVALMHEKEFLETGSPSQVLNEANINTLYGIEARLITCRIDEGNLIRQLVPIGARASVQGGIRR